MMSSDIKGEEEITKWRFLFYFLNKIFYILAPEAKTSFPEIAEAYQNKAHKSKYFRRPLLLTY